MKNLEYVEKNDTFFDAHLNAYKPEGNPVGKLRVSNLLTNSFTVANVADSYYDLKDTIGSHMGLNETIWGIKKNGNDFGWEFYFSDQGGKKPEVNVTHIAPVVKDYFDLNAVVDEDRNYPMFSFDVCDDFFRKKKVDTIHLYIDCHTCVIASLLSYALSGSDVQLENVYFMYDARSQLDLLYWNKDSAMITLKKIDPQEILFPELMDCELIILAKKPEADGIYFSGLNVNDLLFFLNALTILEK